MLSSDFSPCHMCVCAKSPQKMLGAKNMQNLVRFWTTSDFDAEYLRNGWRYSESVTYLIYCGLGKFFTFVYVAVCIVGRSSEACGMKWSGDSVVSSLGHDAEATDKSTTRCQSIATSEPMDCDDVESSVVQPVADDENRPGND